jgi:hypothetical protein
VVENREDILTRFGEKVVAAQKDSRTELSNSTAADDGADKSTAGKLSLSTTFRITMIAQT